MCVQLRGACALGLAAVLLGLLSGSSAATAADPVGCVTEEFSISRELLGYLPGSRHFDTPPVRLVTPVSVSGLSIQFNVPNFTLSATRVVLRAELWFNHFSHTRFMHTHATVQSFFVPSTQHIGGNNPFLLRGRDPDTNSTFSRSEGSSIFLDSLQARLRHPGYQPNNDQPFVLMLPTREEFLIPHSHLRVRHCLGPFIPGAVYSPCAAFPCKPGATCTDYRIPGPPRRQHRSCQCEADLGACMSLPQHCVVHQVKENLLGTADDLAAGQWGTERGPGYNATTTCGTLGTMLGGFGELTGGNSLIRTFTIDEPHSILAIRANLVALDAWDQETLFVEVDGIQITSSGPLWWKVATQNICGATTNDNGVYALEAMVPHASRTFTVRIATTLDRGIANEAFGMLSFELEARDYCPTTTTTTTAAATTKAMAPADSRAAGDRYCSEADGWPRTPQGATALRSCPSGPGAASRQCTQGGRWQRPRFAACRNQGLAGLARASANITAAPSPSTPGEALSILGNLTELLADNATVASLGTEDLEALAAITTESLDSVSTATPVTQRSATKKAIEAVDSVFGRNKALAAASRPAMARIRRGLERGGLALAASGVELRVTLPTVDFVTLPSFSVDEPVTRESGGNSLSLPAGSLRTNSSLVSGVVIWYDDDWIVGGSGQADTSVMVVTLDTDTSALDHDVIFHLNVLRPGSNSLWLHRKCHWFNEETGAFSTEGCQVLLTAPDQLRCRCSHLTAFAGLFASEPASTQGKAHATGLAILSICLGVLSVLLLATFLVILLLLRNEKWFRIPHKINCHSCAAMIGMHSLALFGLAGPTGHACQSNAVALHFFVLATFTWMAIRGVSLYRAVKSVFQDQSREYPLYAILGWVLPGVIVTMTYSLASGDYASDGQCWVDMSSSLQFAVSIPLVLAFATNMGCAAAVLRVVQQSTRSHSTARAVISVACLLSLAWVFAVISYTHDHVMWQYLFGTAMLAQVVCFWYTQLFCSQDIRSALGAKIPDLGRGYSSEPEFSTSKTSNNPRARASQSSFSAGPQRGQQGFNMRGLSTALASMPGDQVGRRQRTSEAGFTFRRSEVFKI